MKTLSDNENPQAGDYRIVENAKGFYIQQYRYRWVTSYVTKRYLFGLIPVSGAAIVDKSDWVTFRDTSNEIKPKYYDSLESAKTTVQKWKHDKETYPKYYYL